MPPTARNSSRRRRKNPDEEVPEQPAESPAQAMAPTRMKLRVRRRDNAAAAAAGGEPERSREGSRSSSRRKNAGKNAATVDAASSSSSPPAPSASARAVMAAEEASPDSKCPICLDRFNNLAYLDRCLHRFCFPCIQEWSHNKAECPLCKQPFASILHSVRAEDDFKEYTLRPPPANSSVAATVAMVAAMASAARSDHHMRLMLRRHRVADGGETATRRRRRERGGRGQAGVWEWYLGSPPVPLPPLPQHFPVPEDGVEAENLPAERGVIFEGLTGLGGAPARLTPHDRASERLMLSLAERLQQQAGGRAAPRLREREMVDFRRALYRFGIRVRGVAGVIGNQEQQQRDVSADSFRRTPAGLSRLHPWLRRELTVLYGAHDSLVDIVQRIITARLARHGLEDTPTVEEELRPFLLARTEHFLHELASFARSPLGLDGYDTQAVYEPAAANMNLSGSSADSSVITISEGEEEGAGFNDDITQPGSVLSLSGWDDETPGPSYSTAPQPFSPAPPEPANEDGGEKEEECLIVGYKKPMAERTPELVQLSSDSEEEKAPPPLYLPIIPPSTSAACREEPEAAQQPAPEASEPLPRARSWSGSSGRNSLCSLSSPSRKRPDGEAAVERRRKRRKRGGRSGTLYNPNRSIYPAMMRHRSLSPFHSSGESGSPPSPLDSSWGFHCAQISPLTSSISSPSRSLSSSPLCSSPLPRTPPTPTLSPSGGAHHGEKPGGKRKYKSRHLDSDAKDPSWRPGGGPDGERRKKRGRDGGRKRQRGEGHKENNGGESSRRSRDDRSPSVEIIYEGTITSNSTQPPSRKRRRTRHRRMQHSSSPVIITLDSDSSHGDVNNNKMNSGSSSPLSSQQTVDFSDLPPLPAAHSTAMGGSLDGELGDLPADILDRGSDGSDSPGRSAARIHIHSDGSDVDVEKVEDGDLLMTCADETPLRHGKVSTATQEDASDRNLLAAILSDLSELSVPRRRGNQNRLAESRHQNRASSPPPLEQPRDGRDPPPLLRPLRNSPPPLKHKDGGSPQRPPVFPRDPPLPLVPLGPDTRTIPPISTLKRPLRGQLPPTSSTPPPLARLGFSFPSPELHSSCDRNDPGPAAPPARTGWLADGPAHSDSTSGGGTVFSGANSNDAIPPPPAGPGGAPGPGSTSKKEILLGRVRSVPTEASSSSPPSDPPPESPSPPLDPPSSIAASGSHIPADEHQNHAALSPSPPEHTANPPTTHTQGTSGSEPSLEPRSHLPPAPQNHCEPGSEPPLHPKLLPDNHITSDSRPAENRSGPDLDSLTRTL